MSSSGAQPRGLPIEVQRLAEYAAADLPARPATAERGGAPHEPPRPGRAVLCRDGQAGQVVRVVPHPRHGGPWQIIVRYGWLKPRELRVSYTWVRSVTSEHIALNLRTRDLLEQPAYRPDDEIAEAVAAALHGPANHGEYLALRATVAEGIVSLHGNVRDSPRRLAAAQIVSRIAGVVAVENCLFADDEIAWSVEWVLQHDRRLETRDLRVEICLGLVRLQGWVGSGAQRELAATIVGQVPGVHALSNGLLVEPAPERRTALAQARPWPAVEELSVR